MGGQLLRGDGAQPGEVERLQQDRLEHVDAPTRLVRRGDGHEDGLWRLGARLVDVARHAGHLACAGHDLDPFVDEEAGERRGQVEGRRRRAGRREVRPPSDVRARLRPARATQRSPGVNGSWATATPLGCPLAACVQATVCNRSTPAARSPPAPTRPRAPSRRRRSAHRRRRRRAASSAPPDSLRQDDEARPEHGLDARRLVRDERVVVIGGAGSSPSAATASRRRSSSSGMAPVTPSDRAMRRASSSVAPVSSSAGARADGDDGVGATAQLGDVDGRGAGLAGGSEVGRGERPRTVHEVADRARHLERLGQAALVVRPAGTATEAQPGDVFREHGRRDAATPPLHRAARPAPVAVRRSRRPSPRRRAGRCRGRRGAARCRRRRRRRRRRTSRLRGCVAGRRAASPTQAWRAGSASRPRSGRRRSANLPAAGRRRHGEDDAVGHRRAGARRAGELQLRWRDLAPGDGVEARAGPFRVAEHELVDALGGEGVGDGVEHPHEVVELGDERGVVGVGRRRQLLAPERHLALLVQPGERQAVDERRRRRGLHHLDQRSRREQALGAVFVEDRFEVRRPPASRRRRPRRGPDAAWPSGRRTSSAPSSSVLVRGGDQRRQLPLRLVRRATCSCSGLICRSSPFRSALTSQQLVVERARRSGCLASSFWIRATSAIAVLRCVCSGVSLSCRRLQLTRDRVALLDQGVVLLLGGGERLLGRREVGVGQRRAACRRRPWRRRTRPRRRRRHRTAPPGGTPGCGRRARGRGARARSAGRAARRDPDRRAHRRGSTRRGGHGGERQVDGEGVGCRGTGGRDGADVAAAQQRGRGGLVERGRVDEAGTGRVDEQRGGLARRGRRRRRCRAGPDVLQPAVAADDGTTPRRRPQVGQPAGRQRRDPGVEPVGEQVERAAHAAAPAGPEAGWRGDRGRRAGRRGGPLPDGRRRCSSWSDLDSPGNGPSRRRPSVDVRASVTSTTRGVDRRRRVDRWRAAARRRRRRR